MLLALRPQHEEEDAQPKDVLGHLPGESTSRTVFWVGVGFPSSGERDDRFTTAVVSVVLRDYYSGPRTGPKLNFNWLAVSG